MRPWEVERDRFGVMFSGPLEVGEVVEVVAAERAERAEAAAQTFAQALQRVASPDSNWDEDGWADDNQRAKIAADALAAHPGASEAAKEDSMTEQTEAILAVCRRIAAAQAEDAALWDPQSIVEAYVVQELRTLHRAIEGDLTVVAAIEDA